MADSHPDDFHVTMDYTQLGKIIAERQGVDVNDTSDGDLLFKVFVDGPTVHVLCRRIKLEDLVFDG